MASQEERVQLLEDLEDVRRLKIDYAGVCDTGYDGAKLAAMFTEDAIWDGGDTFGVHKGRAAIRDFFNEISSDITFALHYMIGHSIDVDSSGTKATGTWYLWEPMTYKGQAVLGAITYDDEYQKVDGRWYFSRMNVQIHFLTPYDKGWVKQRMVT